MPPTSQLVAPRGRVLAVSLGALAAYALARAALARLAPPTDPSNLPPLDLCVGLASLGTAACLYYLGRLRFPAATLLRLEGRLLPELAVLLGLVAAAAALQWRLVPAPIDPSTTLLRVGGVLAAFLAAAAEEAGLRGAAFEALAETGGKGLAAALLLGSVGLALVHLGFDRLWDLPWVAAAGLALGVARWKGASLPSLILAHGLMAAVAPLWLAQSLSLGEGIPAAAGGLALLTAGLLSFLPARAPDPASDPLA